MNRSKAVLLLLTVTFLFSCEPSSTTQTVTLYSVAAMDGPITFTSPDSYTGSATDVSANIGDDDSDTNVIRCVVSFDLSSIPDRSQIESALLRVYQNSESTGDSYSDPSGLGEVYVDNIAYTAFTPDDDLFGGDVIGTGANIGTLSTSFSANTWHQLDVTLEASDEMTDFHSRRLQFRIYHHYQNNNNLVADTDGWVMGDSTLNRPELIITYK
jgi:hypothetical protein